MRRIRSSVEQIFASPETRQTRALVALVLAAPMLIALFTDGLQRGSHLLAFRGWHNLWYALALLQSCAVWGLLLYTSGLGGVGGMVATSLFVVSFTFALGGQVYFFEQYHAYFTQDLALFAANLTDSVLNQLGADAPNYLLAKLPFFLASVMLVLLARALPKPAPRTRGWLAVAGPLLFLGACFIPAQFRSPQAATPDTLYLNALGGFLQSGLGLTEESRNVRPGVRHSRAVPPLTSQRAVPPNVLLLLTESVRADAYCSTYDPQCSRSPHSNALLPHRVGLAELRSVASTTAISLAVLLGGVSPRASYQVMHEAPLLFDYARAAGYSTAYWTSQNLFFANSRLFVKNLGVDAFISGTQLDPHADIDLGADEAKLADVVSDGLAELREPYLAVVHLAATHYPYRVDPQGEQPFGPGELDRTETGRRKLKRHYQNAIVQQDAHVARILSALQSQPSAARTVVLFTSDHGEALREHGLIGHTFTLFDEEIHVPGYVAVPPGLLDAEERAALAVNATKYLYHPDLSATILDLIGVWDAPEMASFKPDLLGQSLLGPLQEPRAIPLTNCASLWTCAFENWGAMQGPIKLFGRTPFEQGWQCYDVANDPTEEHELESPVCDRLQHDVLRWFTRPPL
jgi:glucan phosphoethanolaminetransferase (alkaline phosphatase superfamily)